MKRMRSLSAAISVFALLAIMLCATATASFGLDAHAGGNLLGKGWYFDQGIEILGNPEDGAYEDDMYYAGGNGTVDIVKGGYNAYSEYCLLVSGVDVGNGKTVTGLKPSTTYVLTFWSKADAAEGANPLVGIKEYNGDEEQYETIKNSEWQRYKIEFTTGANETSALFWTWIWGANADLYLDAVRIEEYSDNLIGPGWDFESGLEILGTPDNSHGLVAYINDKFYGPDPSWDIFRIVEGGHDGGSCLFITGVDVGYGKTIDGLRPDTTYRLTFWCKADTVGNGFGQASGNPLIGVKEYNVPEEVVLSISQSDWQEYEIIFTTGATDDSVLFFTWIWGDVADFYVDDVMLVEYTYDNLLGEGWDFEQGLAILGDPGGGAYEGDKYYAGGRGTVLIVEDGYDGGHCLLISGVDIGNGKTVDGLDPDTTYKVTFWARAESSGNAFPFIGVQEYNGSDEYHLTIDNDEWKEFEITFTTGIDNTSAIFWTWIWGNTVDLWVDDVVMLKFEASDLAPPPELEIRPPGSIGESNDSSDSQSEQQGLISYIKDPMLEWITPLVVISISEGVIILALILLLVLPKIKRA